MTTIKESYVTIIAMSILGLYALLNDFTAGEWVMNVVFFVIVVIAIEAAWPKGYTDVPVTYENLDYLEANTAWSREQLEQMLAMIQFRKIEMSIPVKKKAWWK